MRSIPKMYLASVAAAAMCVAIAAPAFAEPDNRDVVHDTGGHIVMNSFGHCVRTKWLGDHDECAPPAPAPAPAPVVRRQTHVTISQEARTVYFPFNKALLTPESKQKLNTLAETLKSDQQVKRAHIVGFADRLGSVSYNEKLSKKRAITVRNYLVSRGFVKSDVAQTRWVGKSEPSTHCPNSLSRPELIQCLHEDRKVEVELEYYPDNQQ